VSHNRRRCREANPLQAFDRADLLRSHCNTLLLALIAAVRWVRPASGSVEEAECDFDAAKPNELLASVFSAERHLFSLARLPIDVLLAVSSANDGNRYGD